ncbi:unnamed protein product, partial [Vitis vinifera]|uniref:Uncharacterized protein n=1 Tax=Vitis vinifera TaxID=29760 RepID=D7TK93_VITVI
MAVAKKAYVCLDSQQQYHQKCDQHANVLWYEWDISTKQSQVEKLSKLAHWLCSTLRNIGVTHDIPKVKPERGLGITC